MSHTPGPWDRNIKPASKYPIIFAGRNTHVAQVITRGIPDDQAEGNADLIAAAPDMLAALEGALASMDARYTDTGMDLVRQIARAAIKLAKGAA